MSKDTKPKENTKSNLPSSKDLRNAIVWRKSIYDKDYVCGCGKKLFDDGKMAEDVLFDPESRYLFCPKCFLNVAKWLTVDEAYSEGATRIDQ